MPPSPYRAADRTLSAAAIDGRSAFLDAGCMTCHSGEALSDSPSGGAHDVGTISGASGQRLHGPLTGIDTPTLLGLWQSAPYLHDGSAATVGDAILAHTLLSVGGNEAARIAAYLNELEAPDLSGPDSDLDGFVDANDNCTAQPNPSQRDSDADGIGDACDADFNNDCQVNAGDLAIMRSAFYSDDPVTDLNADGVVNAQDLGVLKQRFFAPPGPSGLAPCSI